MTQLPLRPVGPLERIKVRVLSRLLWLANSDVSRGCRIDNAWVKARFYHFIKEPILTRYGTVLEGMDIQKIVLECRGCGGTGQWGSHRRDGGAMCFRCNGTGIYRTDYFGLARFDLGGRLFLKPTLGWIGSMPPADMRVTMYGRCIHAIVGIRGTEALLWLALLYDRPLFRFLMLPGHLITDRFTPWPLVAIQTTLRLWLSPYPGHRLRRLCWWLRDRWPRRCSVCGKLNFGPFACDECIPF